MTVVNNVSQLRTPLPALQSAFAILKLGGVHYVIRHEEIDNLVGDLHLHKRPDAVLAIKRFLETLPSDSDPKQLIENFYVDLSTDVYTATAFSPLKTPADVLNLWREPTVEPDAGGNSDLLKKHLREVICDGDKTKYKYVI